MLNNPVPAAVEGMPKFNRSEIMKAAWAHFRKAKAYVTSNPYLAGTVVRFGDCLKEEWKNAKRTLHAVVMPALVALRVAALKSTLQALDCKSFRYSIAPERRSLCNELEALLGSAAPV